MTSTYQIQDRAQRTKALQATLLLRIFAVVMVWVTLPVRTDLPTALVADYGLHVLPLLGANCALLVLSRAAPRILFQYPLWLCLDLAGAAWVLSLGGGWRSSYFEYTLTTVIIATIIARKKGCYLSSTVLSIVALFKNPIPSGDPIIAFQVGAWDMRMGASLFYVTAGLVLGYFNTLLDRVMTLSEESILEAGRRAAVEEKMALALNLHDRLKSKLTAILWMFKLSTQNNPNAGVIVQADCVRLWYWLNYLQKELSGIVYSLRGTHDRTDESNALFSVYELVREEARIIQELTGFNWKICIREGDAAISKSTAQWLSGLLSEALTNAFKHSGRLEGTICVGRKNGQVAIEIQDQGQGFDSDEMNTEATAGLANIKHRAMELGGKLTIQSESGGGCRLHLLFPVNEDNAELDG